MRSLTEKALIVCLVINTVLTSLLLVLGWKAYRGLERVERRAARIEAFADDIVRDAAGGKEKAADAYRRYREWREKSR